MVELQYEIAIQISSPEIIKQTWSNPFDLTKKAEIVLSAKRVFEHHSSVSWGRLRN
jgi:hypothetical protein